MNFWKLPRVPESEIMDEAAQVESYSSAAAARHLDAIDDTFVEHLFGLLPPERAPAGSFVWGLDVGTGPAQIPIKILRRNPGLRFIGLDRSANMLRQARLNADQSGVSDRLILLVSDGLSLPFPDGAFGVVACNSVLHHARDAARLLQEIFRVATPAAAVLVRDLRRPARLWLRWHLWRHGRHYSGLMRRLFEDSVRAAYTPDELRNLLLKSPRNGARVFGFRRAHIGIERAAGSASGGSR